MSDGKPITQDHAIQTSSQALLKAIRTKCQQAHWLGPDALMPASEHALPPADPFVDEDVKRD